MLSYTSLIPFDYFTNMTIIFDTNAFDKRFKIWCDNFLIIPHYSL